MDILPLLVEWEDGSVSDVKNSDLMPVNLILFGIQKIPIFPFLDVKELSIEEWISRNPNCHITLSDLFDNYWKISLTLKELGLGYIYVFSHTNSSILNVLST